MSSGYRSPAESATFLAVSVSQAAEMQLAAGDTRAKGALGPRRA
jgi:hypothetical protein